MGGAKGMKASKFTFGASFDAPVQPKKTAAPTFSEQQLKDAEAAAFAEGKAVGYGEAMADITERTAAACANLSNGIAELLAAEAKRREMAQAQAAEIALAIGRKLAPALLAAAPLVEVRQVVADCLALAYGEERLLVRVAEDLVDDVRTACEAVAQSQGFMGKLMILGDPQCRGSDCRVEWADGGCERNEAAIDQEINQIIARYIEGRRRNADADQS